MATKIVNILQRLNFFINSARSGRISLTPRELAKLRKIKKLYTTPTPLWKSLFLGPKANKVKAIRWFQGLEPSLTKRLQSSAAKFNNSGKRYIAARRGTGGRISPTNLANSTPPPGSTPKPTSTAKVKARVPERPAPKPEPTPPPKTALTPDEIRTAINNNAIVRNNKLRANKVEKTVHKDTVIYLESTDNSNPASVNGTHISKADSTLIEPTMATIAEESAKLWRSGKRPFNIKVSFRAEFDFGDTVSVALRMDPRRGMILKEAKKDGFIAFNDHQGTRTASIQNIKKDAVVGEWNESHFGPGKIPSVNISLPWSDNLRLMNTRIRAAFNKAAKYIPRSH